MAEKHRAFQIQMQNHQYTLQNPCIHPNDTYRRAYIPNKRKAGAHTWPHTPNQGFHPIGTIPHLPRSPRTHVHDHKLSIVNSNTDTRARGTNDESPPWANTPLTRPNARTSQITSPQSNTCPLQYRTIISSFSFPSHPRLVFHTSTPSRARQSYYLSPPASTD